MAKRWAKAIDLQANLKVMDLPEILADVCRQVRLRISLASPPPQRYRHIAAHVDAPATIQTTTNQITDISTTQTSRGFKQKP